jgi:hypothetical protein
MSGQEYKIGDLVEVVKVSPDGRRPQVLAGQTPKAQVGEQGIVVETFATEFRVLCGTIKQMKWEANCSTVEVKLVERLGAVEANRRLSA